MGFLKLFCSSGRWDQNKIKDFDLKCPTNFVLSLENEVLLLVHPRTCIMHACTIPHKKKSKLLYATGSVLNTIHPILLIITHVLEPNLQCPVFILSSPTSSTKQVLSMLAPKLNCSVFYLSRTNNIALSC